jgi:hypothetical protein
VKLEELKFARDRYRYVPARLVQGVNGGSIGITWKSLILVQDVPPDWQSADATARARYSSFELDEFHRVLLNSNEQEHLMHGLLSVVFWGFASGSDGRINAERALARSRAIVHGRANSSPQPSNDIIYHLREARQALNASSISEALQHATKIKFLGMSFASKVLTFMRPTTAAIYDDVISSRLRDYADPNLRNMYVSMRLANSREAKMHQANKYEEWCHWCSQTSITLNNRGILWTDWNGIERTWRAVDVERAFFALGR